MMSTDEEKEAKADRLITEYIQALLRVVSNEKAATIYLTRILPWHVQLTAAAIEIMMKELETKQRQGTRNK